jgi:hypothetical protein
MRRAQVTEISEVPLPADRALHRHEVDQRANRCLDSVDSTNLGPVDQLDEGDSCGFLREQIEMAAGFRSSSSRPKVVTLE